MTAERRIMDRCRGALFGLAIGDALGAAVEFKPRGSFEPVTGYRSGGPHRLNAGEWTDDTSLALALADSIGSAGWDLNDQAERYYVLWMKHGKYSVNGRCFDIGITTSQALHTFIENNDARTSGSRAESASGNGSIMRLAPVPIRYHDLYPNKIAELATLAEESSLTTHASEQCKSACRYMALVLSALIHGENRDEVLRPEWGPLEELNAAKPLHPQILGVARGSFREKEPPTIRGSGWVVQSLEAALWAFHNANSFEAAVLRAVNLGDDADTTGAVCGQLAGAFWGANSIPKHLRDGLSRHDLLSTAFASLGVSTSCLERFLKAVIINQAISRDVLRLLAINLGWSTELSGRDEVGFWSEVERRWKAWLGEPTPFDDATWRKLAHRLGLKPPASLDEAWLQTEMLPALLARQKGAINSPQLGKRTGRPRKDERSKDDLVIAALVKHHGWEQDGSATNPNPISVRDLVRLGTEPNSRPSFSTATVSRFFDDKFPDKGHKGYVLACNGGQIGLKLSLWQGDIPPQHDAKLLDDEEAPTSRKRGQRRKGRSPGSGRTSDDEH